MTQIWDSTGQYVRKLMDDFTEEGARDLSVFMQILKKVVTKKKEYATFKPAYWFHSVSMLQEIDLLSARPVTKDDLGLILDIIETMHDFDHLDLPYNGKQTFGHFTESTIFTLKLPVKEQNVIRRMRGI